CRTLRGSVGELAHSARSLSLTRGDAELPKLNVCGWGGGTTFAELYSSHRYGHQPMMLSSDARRLSLIEQWGLTPLDRSRFLALAYDEVHYQNDSIYGQEYLHAEEAFFQELKHSVYSANA